MKLRRKLSAAFFFALMILTFPAGLVMAQGTDEIKEYDIAITPQSDGSLIADYAINWCVISDAAGPLSWITLGMPNEGYDVLGYGGDVSSVSPDNSGFDYLLRIDLAREANAGDCVDIQVKVRLTGMAYLNSEKGEVYYQFTPGWFNDVPVEHLKLTWNMPSDTTQVTLLLPEPASKSESQAVWETRLDAGDKFTVNLFYNPAAFPDLDASRAVSEPPVQENPTAAVEEQPSSAPYPSSSTEISQPGFFETAFGIVCICVIIIVAIVILVIIIRAIASSTTSYRGGGYFGGYRGSGWTSSSKSSSGGSIFGSGSGSAGRSERSGGGSGLFGGRGSSCACVSSGCACACAGGGRAGCSRKGFDVSSLFEPREENQNEV